MNILFLLLVIPKTLPTTPGILGVIGTGFCFLCFHPAGQCPLPASRGAVSTDLREGASGLEQLPTVLGVTDPNVPKVLVFHDIAALQGQKGVTWEWRATGATSVRCGSRDRALQQPPDLTYQYGPRAGGGGSPRMAALPRELRADMRGEQHSQHPWGTALPSPPSLPPAACSAHPPPPPAIRFQPLLTATSLFDALIAA